MVITIYALAVIPMVFGSFFVSLFPALLVKSITHLQSPIFTGAKGNKKKVMQYTEYVFAVMRNVIKVASSRNGQQIRERVREIREDSLEHMEEYLGAFIESVEENGAHVHRAADSRTAQKILRDLAGEESAVKSKTNVGKEIEIHKVVKAVETDTGDFIAEMLGDSGHPILPALGIAPEEIANTLTAKYGVSTSPEPANIVSAVRRILRREILSAGIGITGANVLTADGEIFIVENEGNVALTSHVPEMHVVVTSMEKLVRDSVHAMQICKALSLFGTGQKTPTYVNMISGPSKTADVGEVVTSPAQGPKELHVILLDNGRSELLRSQYREILKCINCGACISTCPVFHVLGKKYGFEHCGTRGILLQRFQKSDGALFERAFYCTGCTMCREVCPAGVDLPELMRRLRRELHGKGLQTEKNVKMIENVLKGGDTFGGKKMDTDTEFYCC